MLSWVVPRKFRFRPIWDEAFFYFYISFYIFVLKIEAIHLRRTIYCGEVREENIGQRVTCCGWMLTKRDMGGVIFIDLRDREGVLQVVFNAQNLSEDEFKIAESLRNQYVILVEGKIRLRDEDTVNRKIQTGTVELMADHIELISTCETLPFSLDDDEIVREDLRLKYRFLDLRRQPMINNLKFRHKVQKVTQDYLDNDGFICVETPMLMKSTPEGARDYLVPSRVHTGTFYALPQSPQIFKQILMVGGIDKYYQVARCFRDEDLRADRQPEFTQVDMEMSFVEQEDVLVHLEKLFKYIFKETMGKEVDYDFPRLTWNYCMDTYGSDKPDLRYDLPIVDITDIAKECSFSVFKKAVEDGGVVRAINVKGGAEFTRTTIEHLTEKALKYGAKGMAWIMIRPDGEIYSLLKKFFSQKDIDAIINAVDAKNGDFILFCADKLKNVRRILGNLRCDIANIQGLIKEDDYKFLIVTDFPQFEWSDEENRFMATHHPFTMPYEEDVQYLITAPEKVRAQAYDVVLNGVELGSGSVRIHKPDVQTKMFEALGFTDEQIENRFGFMVNAFKYGTPPHAGFAFGLDRLVMLLTGSQSLRDVIAFPKNKDASCPMTGAPDFVDKEQLDALKLGMFAEEQESEMNIKHKKNIEIDVENVANLARLSLTSEEKESMKSELSAIIGFADKLEEIDTNGVDVTAHIVPISNVLRDDVVTNTADRDNLLSNAPTMADGYMTVPKTFD